MVTPSKEARANVSHVERGVRELAHMLRLDQPPRVRRAWAGYMDVTPDMLPIIDGTVGIEGLVVGSGLSGGGFVQGPGLGEILAGLALGEPAQHDLSPFALRRFS